MLARLALLTIGLTLNLPLLASAGADHAKNLVGVWEVTKGEHIGQIIEFTKDGKLKVSEKNSKDAPLEGMYKLKEQELTLQVTLGAITEKQTVTIKTLTEKQLVLTNTKEKVVEFKRVK